MNPLVTVIIPAYRYPQFLNAALRSVTAQTYSPIEIIIVDDASGEEYMRQYELPANARLIVHEINRATASISRNEALAASHGEFVTFLDQDDLFAPEKIARQVATLQSDPAALLTYCHYQRVAEDLTPLPKQDRPQAVQNNPVRQMLLRNIVHCPAQVMVRRSAFDKIGLFDEAIRGAADYDMWLRAAMGGRVLGDPTSLVHYRHHSGQWHKQGVMICRGTVRVLEKAVVWAQRERPELAGLARRRMGRWLRELAREQLLSNNEKQQAFATLRQSLLLRPWDMQAYRYLWPAWRASRTVGF